MKIFKYFSFILVLLLCSCNTTSRFKVTGTPGTIILNESGQEVATIGDDGFVLIEMKRTNLTYYNPFMLAYSPETKTAIPFALDYKCSKTLGWWCLTWGIIGVGVGAVLPCYFTNETAQAECLPYQQTNQDLIFTKATFDEPEKVVSSVGGGKSSATNTNDPIQIVGSGTGFAIDKRGYFVTNYHVVEDAGAIGICIQKGGEWVSYNGKVIKTDPTNDIAIIKIDDEEFKGFNNIPYSFNFESEDVASDIFTLGYPRVEVMGTDIKYTTGVINSRTGIQGDPTHYQISAHIDHGNSGGPLFNAKGQVIGITDSGLDKAEFGDVNYSVKSLYIKSLVESLPVKLQLPNDSRLSNMSRSEQIKAISPYVALILIAQ